MKKSWIIIVSLGIILLLAACSTSSSTELKDEDTLTIYTSIYPLEDFAKKIGGAHVQVKTLIPAGSDSHTYEPTSKEILNIARADAFIYNGLGMESYADKIKDTLKSEDVLIVEASDGVEAIKHAHGEEHEHGEENHDNGHEEADHEEDEHDEHEHHHGDIDPHVWLDPVRAEVLASNIKDALIKLQPEFKAEFEQNYETLKNDLEALDEDFHNLASQKENPEMIVSHAAYGYWEQSYGIKQIPIAGLSSSEEPSQGELTKIIQLAKEKNIQYVIFEQNITPKVAEVIREEIKAEPLYLHNLSTLTTEDIENGEDYFSLMKRNLETLEKALK
ncbi:metal ABC transporter solute-binding protein, Zn/Mn family [Ornithinibacillus bavariensis]|uniref:Adhesin n=1 Tax=Ornithinibacillus bavariensis TaxID=545502 RepID=A0A920C6Y3_9BACI|nr:zinc ABC transporter substrate-binding protein [Ornithinibacillus bavariensis]GIO26589.1 adhesin [Ornithinibacillus bavariensis]